MKQFPICLIDKQLLLEFKNLLVGYGYTYEQLLKSGINAYAYDLFDLPVIFYRYKSVSPFNTLLKLFFLGEKISVPNLRKIFQEYHIREFRKSGIFEKAGTGFLRSAICIVPYRKYYFASDFVLQRYDRNQNILQKNLVYPVSPDSITLAESIIRKKVNLSLDLCCGCGIHAITASEFSKKVIGTDINPRAVDFSKFNALMNNIPNCEFYTGNLFEPVRGQKFDLILSNPPYEITFRKTHLFQDGAKDGQKILKRIIEEIPSYLNNRGFVQIITKFSEYWNVNDKQNIRNWMTDDKLDVLIIRLYSSNTEKVASEIAANELKNDGKIDLKKYPESYLKYISHFDRIGLEKVSFGLITLRKWRYFRFFEKNFDSSKISANDFSEKVQYDIQRYFILSLGLYGYKYFISYRIVKFRGKVILFTKVLFRLIFKLFTH